MSQCASLAFSKIIVDFSFYEAIRIIKMSILLFFSTTRVGLNFQKSKNFIILKITVNSRGMLGKKMCKH
jgi:hypothetical protein